jgi:AcrR family transcriptional regulator
MMKKSETAITSMGAQANNNYSETPLTTRERITDESLTLFSQRGYSGVSVKNIADAVGIKDSSLYKHFTSKREIFDTILAEMTERMDQLTENLKLADASKGDASSYFSTMSVDDLVALSEQVFLFYLKNPFAARFRRMLTIEQYSDSEISTLYRKIFTEDSIAYQSILFGQLIACGAFIEADPTILAMNFYSPLLLLFIRYDAQPDKESEALDLLERHVREFARRYKVS